MSARIKSPIQFGTDGWRGVIGDDFTFANVRLAAAAVSEYVHAKEEAQRGLIVGFDTRFLSAEFGRASAEVIAAAGIPAFLADQAAPTPAISFAVVNRKAAGAVVITASHNPYRWNGFKFKAGYGGSALPSITSQIEAHLGRLARSPKRKRKPRAAPIETVDLKRPYLERLKVMTRLDRVRASGLRFVIDPMYGAARGYLAALFEEAGVPCREIHSEHNPLFPGLNPEPIEPHVGGLRQAVVSGGYDAGFATDGDADRIGAVDRSGEFIDSHKIFSILLRHLAVDLQMRGDVAKTFSTTQMVDKLASKYGLPLHITPIGFKYICELMLKRDILIGGEESGGISVKGHLPERDGMLNALLLAQVMAERGLTLSEMIEELSREVGPHFYERRDLQMDNTAAAQVVRRVKRLHQASVAGHRATRVEDLDGVKLFFGDSAWLLVRASGTEDVLRLYSEAPSRDETKAILDEMEAFARNSN